MKSATIFTLMFYLFTILSMDSNSKRKAPGTNTMVLILDGNLEHVARVSKKLGLFEEEKINL